MSREYMRWFKKSRGSSTYLRNLTVRMDNAASWRKHWETEEKRFKKLIRQEEKLLEQSYRAMGYEQE